MGHRHSPNLEFKSAQHFNPQRMMESIPFLRDAQVVESRWSFLKASIGGPNPVEMTFSGGQTIAQIHPPDRASNGLAVASLADLAGEKMYQVSQRTTEADCRDVIELLYQGTTMDEMFGCAKAMYRDQFDSLAATWNLTNFDRSGVKLGPEAASVLIREGAQAHALVHAPAHTAIHAERITTEARMPTQKMPRQHNFQRAVDPYDLRDPLDQHDPREEREL
jgi:hypothetical protein